MVVALISGFILWGLFIFCAVALKMPARALLVVMMLLGWLCIAVPALTLFKKIDIAAGPMQFAIGAPLLGIIIVLSITLLPFGWQVALSNIYFDVTAETTPPGTWEVNQIEPSRSQGQAGAVPPLEHSVVYQDERALTLICDWMERTEMRSHADR
jgi:hypothetical protein